MSDCFFAIHSFTHSSIPSFKKMDREALRNRTKQFAVRVVKVFRALPKTDDAKVIGRQLLRSGTSVAANYRAVCRARSRAEFIAKMSIVIEECDETAFWLELMGETDILDKARLTELHKEAIELLSIFAKARITATKNK